MDYFTYRLFTDHFHFEREECLLDTSCINSHTVISDVYGKVLTQLLMQYRIKPTCRIRNLLTLPFIYTHPQTNNQLLTLTAIIKCYEDKSPAQCRRDTGVTGFITTKFELIYLNKFRVVSLRRKVFWASFLSCGSFTSQNTKKHVKLKVSIKTHFHSSWSHDKALH